MTFFGCIINKGFNFRGSWNDTKSSYHCGLINLLESDELTLIANSFLCDSVFAVEISTIRAKIVRERKSTEIPGPPEMYEIDMVLQQVYSSERQSADWGMRCLKGPLGLFRLPLTVDSKKGGRLSTHALPLLNIQTRRVGLNHIPTTFKNGENDPSPCIQRFQQEQNIVEVCIN